jgi:hypothetical protein
VIAEARSWEILRENEYKTQTGYVVRVEMVVPRFIDLRKEQYLWVNPQDVSKLKDVKTNTNEQKDLSS